MMRGEGVFVPRFCSGVGGVRVYYADLYHRGRCVYGIIRTGLEVEVGRSGVGYWVECICLGMLLLVSTAGVRYQ